MAQGITVVNHYHGELPPGSIRVHRPHPLGNPYHRDQVGGKDMAIHLYRQWLWEGIKTKDWRYEEICKLAKQYQTTGELVLVCYCAPKACHADIIGRAVEWVLAQDRAV